MSEKKTLTTGSPNVHNPSFHQRKPMELIDRRIEDELHFNKLREKYKDPDKE